MEKSQTRILFLDIMINKSGTKVWMDIYNKPTDFKTLCPIYVKPPTGLFNKYTVLFCKKNMYHC